MTWTFRNVWSTLLQPSFSLSQCLLVSTFWTRCLRQHLVSEAYLFSTTAGLTLASFVPGLAVLRELTLPPFLWLSAGLTKSGRGGVERLSVSVFSSSFKNFPSFDTSQREKKVFFLQHVAKMFRLPLKRFAVGASCADAHTNPNNVKQMYWVFSTWYCNACHLLVILHPALDSYVKREMEKNKRWQRKTLLSVLK